MPFCGGMPDMCVAHFVAVKMPARATLDVEYFRNPMRNSLGMEGDVAVVHFHCVVSPTNTSRDNSRPPLRNIRETFPACHAHHTTPILRPDVFRCGVAGYDVGECSTGQLRCTATWLSSAAYIAIGWWRRDVLPFINEFQYE